MYCGRRRRESYIKTTGEVNQLGDTIQKRYLQDKPELLRYFETLPTALQEMILMESPDFSTVEEMRCFVENIQNR